MVERAFGQDDFDQAGAALVAAGAGAAMALSASVMSIGAPPRLAAMFEVEARTASAIAPMLRWSARPNSSAAVARASSASNSTMPQVAREPIAMAWPAGTGRDSLYCS